jgi:hypothetical protein
VSPILRAAVDVRTRAETGRNDLGGLCDEVVGDRLAGENPLGFGDTHRRGADPEKR